MNVCLETLHNMSISYNTKTLCDQPVLTIGQQQIVIIMGSSKHFPSYQLMPWWPVGNAFQATVDEKQHEMKEYFVKGRLNVCESEKHLAKYFQLFEVTMLRALKEILCQQISTIVSNVSKCQQLILCQIDLAFWDGKQLRPSLSVGCTFHPWRNFSVCLVITSYCFTWM